jgi:hypothetical protein
MVSSRDETLDCCAGATLLSLQPHPRPAALAAVDKYHAGVFKRATEARPCCSDLSQAPYRRGGLAVVTNGEIGPKAVSQAESIPPKRPR